MSTVSVARGLVGPPHRPVRLRSSRKSLNAVCLKTCGVWIWGRFATQRGQAPSPQVGVDADLLY
ncbi:hypothetical protein EAH78_22940 [Pseudomonas arsenicoxydans]|uniref:Uncharacterized protein n=1 Tax=Pseudomonas arsenicoxydans TaxID=702115 RepID=A0A502HN30_9PSED|nr:hypothetical protein EAH78_22940 [Pseudomonas arsenicoxydans]